MKTKKPKAAEFIEWALKQGFSGGPVGATEYPDVLGERGQGTDRPLTQEGVPGIEEALLQPQEEGSGIGDLIKNLVLPLVGATLAGGALRGISGYDTPHGGGVSPEGIMGQALQQGTQAYSGAVKTRKEQEQARAELEAEKEKYDLEQAWEEYKFAEGQDEKERQRLHDIELQEMKDKPTEMEIAEHNANMAQYAANTQAKKNLAWKYAVQAENAGKEGQFEMFQQLGNLFEITEKVKVPAAMELSSKVNDEILYAATTGDRTGLQQLEGELASIADEITNTETVVMTEDGRKITYKGTNDAELVKQKISSANALLDVFMPEQISTPEELAAEGGQGNLGMGGGGLGFEGGQMPQAQQDMGANYENQALQLIAALQQTKPGSTEESTAAAAVKEWVEANQGLWQGSSYVEELNRLAQ